MPDADVPKTVEALATAAFGCAGERCMAGSTALTVGAAKPAVAPALYTINTPDAGLAATASIQRPGTLAIWKRRGKGGPKATPCRHEDRQPAAAPTMPCARSSSALPVSFAA